MKTEVEFTYRHLAHEYNVTATFTREDKPLLAMHRETGAEGEWQMQDIRVEDEDGECWYMEMREVYLMKKHPHAVLPVTTSLATIVLALAYGEIE